MTHALLLLGVVLAFGAFLAGIVAQDVPTMAVALVCLVGLGLVAQDPNR